MPRFRCKPLVTDATDARILAARATIGGAVVSGRELARTAGVAPSTAIACVKRLSARGEWPHPPLASPRRKQARVCPVGPKHPHPVLGRTSHPKVAPGYLIDGDHWNRPESRFEAACRARDERKARKRGTLRANASPRLPRSSPAA